MRRRALLAGVAVALLAAIGWLLRPDTDQAERAQRAAAVREELTGGRARRAPREAPPEAPPEDDTDAAYAEAVAASGKVLDEAQIRRGKEEAWLPEPLYGLLGEMDRLQPTPARLERLDDERGEPLSDAQRGDLLQAYKDRFEDAAMAAGRWRLGEIDVEDATAAMREAHEGYRADVAAIAGVEGDAYERVFGWAE